MRFSNAPRFFVRLGIAAVLGGAPAFAAEPWLDAPFSADPGAALKAAEAPLAGETGENSPWFRLLLDESRWSFEEDGSYTVAHRRVLRILSHQGAEELGSISASWKPWLEQPPRLKARVIRPNGAALLLDETSIAETPASSDPSLFDDRRVLRAPLPGVEPGALVEWEVVKRRTTPLPGGALGSHTLAFDYPVGRSRCRVDAPAALPVAWKSAGIDLQPRTTLERGRVVRLWERVAVTPLEDAEEGLPPEIPQSPFVEFGTGTSWGDVASRYREWIDSRISEGPVPPGLLPAGPFPSRLHEAAAIAERVRRDVRYTGLSFGDGILVPDPPAEVVRRRFGDCKDQATLLVAALRARGFDAAVALLRAGEDPDVTPALPSLDAFDHAIVHVADLGGNGVFVDTTSRFERLGEVPLSIQGRVALLCRPGTTGLVRIPVAPSAANFSRTRVEVRVPESGPTRCVETTVYGGAFESSRRSAFDGLAEADLKAYFERWASARYAGGTVSRSRTSAPRDLSEPFRVEVEVERPGLVTADDERVVFTLATETFLGNLPDPAETPRRHDLAVTPVRQEFEYTLVPPSGFAPLDLPPAASRPLGPATLTTKAEERADGKVVLTVVVEIASSRLTPDETRALREALADLREGEPVSLTFRHEAEVAAAHGDLKKGLAILSDEIRNHPAKAAPHRRLARLYLSAGLGEAARREAREAVRKDPRSGGAWYLLGVVLEHDGFGRLRRKGWAPEEAEKALRKAIELDPEDVEPRFELAILLEHDAGGTRYADPARLGRALDEYRTLLEKWPALTVVARNNAFALLRADRFADLLAFLEKRSDVAEMAGLKVVAIAGTRGAEKGMEQLRRDVPEPGARRRSAAEIGSMLVGARRYEEALLFLREAARGGEGAGAAAIQVEAVKLLKRVDGPVPAPAAGDPVSAVRAYMAGLVDPATSAEALAAFFSAPVREARDALGVSPLLESIRTQLRGIARTTSANAIPRPYLRDTLLAAELSAEGNAEEGWLVTGTFLSAGRAPTRIRVWVTEEKGIPRLVSEDGTGAMLCWQALGLAGQGDLAAARAWLERAAHEVEGSAVDVNLLLDPLLPQLRPGEDAGVREIRVAALAGLTGTSLPDALLEEIRAFQREAPADPLRAALLYRALSAREAVGPERGGRDSRRLLEEALPLLEVVRSDRTSAEAAAITVVEVLSRASRLAEALAAAEEHSRSHTGCRFVGPLLVSLRLAAKDETGALEAAERLMSRPAPSAADANTAAWVRYAVGKADEKALSLARQAVEGTGRNRPPVLNTLGAICAEVGRNEEAHGLVVRSMELEGLDEPYTPDWLVVGRIRENHGLTEEALEAYGRLATPDGAPALPDSYRVLAARRAEALATTAKKRR